MFLEPSTNLFPQRVEPRKLFVKNGVVSGIIPLSRLQRLSQYLSNTQGQAEATIAFSHDEIKRRVVSGPVKANVHVLCQRCLQELAVELESSLSVLVLSEKQWDNDTVNALPQGQEAVRVEEIEDFDIESLIEDELILSLPIVVNHEAEDCNVKLNKLKTSAENIEEESNKPFADLQALKEQLSKST